MFFEALLVPMFLIIGVWGSARRVYASVKFFLYTMAGSAFLLARRSSSCGSRRRSSSGRGPSTSARLEQLVAARSTTQRWLFLAFFVAFAVKVPLFPLHTWLPDAHTEAPTPARSSWRRCC